MEKMDMAKQDLFCPHCGYPSHGTQICEKCGSEISERIQQPQENQTNQIKSQEISLQSQFTESRPEPIASYTDEQWIKLEKSVLIIGKWAWLLTLIVCIIQIILAIVKWAQIPSGSSISFDMGWDITWSLGSAVMACIIVFTTIRKISIEIENKAWQKLVDDVVFLGEYKIPKMVVFGLILAFLLNGWGGCFILYPAFVIILRGPVKFSWNKGK